MQSWSQESESKGVVVFSVSEPESQSGSNRFKGRSRESDLEGVVVFFHFPNRSRKCSESKFEIGSRSNIFFQFLSRSRIGSRVGVGSRSRTFSSFEVRVGVEQVQVSESESERVIFFSFSGSGI